MLSRLMGYFTILKQEAEEARNRLTRYLKIEELKRYCLEQNLSFYPEGVEKLPTFAGRINKFIEERARRDLPYEQFTEQVTPSDLRTLVEIGGILGYNGDLHEIAYSSPNVENIRLLVPLPTDPTKKIPEKVWVEMYGRHPIGPKTIETSISLVFNRDALNIADTLIDWHTHPFGHGELSEDDLDAINSNINDFHGKEVYFVLFQPNKNQTYWHQFKKAGPKK